MTGSVYLGDSVYAGLDEGRVALYLDNGFGPTCVIILEPEVLSEFQRWLDLIRKESK